MDYRDQERRQMVRDQLAEMSGYAADQTIDEKVLKAVLDQKKNGEFDENLFNMIIGQTRKVYGGNITIDHFADTYCHAEDNLIQRNKKIEEEINVHRLKQEEFTRYFLFKY